MEWRDRGYILATRRHGESALIVSALTETRGRQSGLVRGGASSRRRGDLQVGNLMDLTWRGRLAEHLGTFTGEVIHAPAAECLDAPDALAALSAACAVTEALLPEGEEHPAIFHGLAALLACLTGPDIGSAYVKWELGVLGELGFGLDLSACAATGGNDDLVYVSPKSGRAVSAGAGEPWRDRLLPLPAFLLRGGGAGTAAEVAAGLALTGHFLERHAFDGPRRRLPARERLVERFLHKK